MVSEQHHQKKSAHPGKGRGKCITVLVLMESSGNMVLPKGAARELLRRNGQVKDIVFQRHFSEDEVENILVESFANLGNVQLQYLQ